MKKVLIGLAAGALAFTATASSVSAGAPDNESSIYEWVGALSANGELLVEAAGLDKALDDCGNGKPAYTLFLPAIFNDTDATEAVLAALDTTLGGLLAQPALVKAILLNHVVNGSIPPVEFDVPTNTYFKSLGGLDLLKTNAGGAVNNGAVVSGEYNLNGYGILGGGQLGPFQACNGWIYLLAGILAPNSASPTVGVTTDGSANADGSAASGSGAGLPATGSESLAFTYAALASLIAGAGVLVIRRRSVA